MLTHDQLTQLVSANESLRVQLDELNDILAIREEELALLKKNAADNAELRSRLDSQLGELESTQYELGKKQQKIQGAEERELELHQELTQAARRQQQYVELQQQYIYLQTQYNDLQEELTNMTAQYMQLRKTASRVGQLESELANTLRENNDLRTQVSELEQRIRNRPTRFD